MKLYVYIYINNKVFNFNFYLKKLFMKKLYNNFEN